MNEMEETTMTTLTMPRPRRDSGMEGMTAKWYAANTAEMMKEYVDLARRVAAELPLGSSMLEIAPGPGYFSIELAKHGPYIITGIDISRTFVKMAAEKAEQAGVKVDFRRGSASNLHIQDSSYDFILCRAAFKNFANPITALKEMCRVLKPGGKALLIDLKGNASSEEISREVDGMGLTRFNRIFTKLIFKTMLIKRAYTKEQFQQMLAETSFSHVDILESNVGLEISMTK